MKRIKLELENEKISSSTKLTKAVAECAELTKEVEKVRKEGEKNVKEKDTEILGLKKRVSALEKAGLNAKKLNEMKQTYIEKISS